MLTLFDFLKWIFSLDKKARIDPQHIEVPPDVEGLSFELWLSGVLDAQFFYAETKGARIETKD